MNDYPIKPCIECGCKRPQLLKIKQNNMYYFAVLCADCEKSTDAYNTIIGACEHWDSDRKRLLPDEVRASIKKINARHEWRGKKKDYLP